MSEIRVLREQLLDLGQKLDVIAARLDVLEGCRHHIDRHPRIAVIVRAAADITGFDRAEIMAPTRVGALVRVRHAAIRAAREIVGYSFAQLARAFRRDHSTITYAARQAEALYTDDPDFRMLCDRIEALARARLTPSRLSEGTADAAAHHPA